MRPVWSRGGSVWGRGWHNNWGWGIWSRGRFVSRDWRVDRLSSVFDISNVSSIMVGSIGNSLNATIRKVDVVLSIGVVSIAVLIGSKIDTSIVVIDSISIVICWGHIRVDGSWGIDWGWSVGRSWGISWGNDIVSSDSSHKCK